VGALGRQQPSRQQPVDFNALVREVYLLPLRLGWPVVGLALLQGLPDAVRLGWTYWVLGPHLPELQKVDLPPEELMRRLMPLFQPLVGPSLLLQGASFVASALISGVLVARFSDALLERPRPAAESWAQALRRLPQLLLANLLVVLALGAALLAFCLPAVPLSALLLGVTPLVVLEGASPLSALSRSVELCRPRLWALVGLQILVWSSWLFAGSAAQLLGSPLTLLGPGGAAAVAALGQLGYAVGSTLGYAAMAVVYQRLRK
jgi:hypothetical protein